MKTTHNEKLEMFCTTFIQDFIKSLVSSMLANGISDPRTVNAFVERTAFTLNLDVYLVMALINEELGNK